MDEDSYYTPTFPTPNYINPVTRGNSLIIVSALLTFIAATFVSLHFLSHYLYAKISPDDICIFVAWVMSVGLCVCDNLATHRDGWDRHIWDVPPEWISSLALSSFVGRLFYNFAGGLTRLSILSFYYRLIQGATWTRTYRYILHVAVVAVIILCLVPSFLIIFQCHPVSAYWAFPRPMPWPCHNEAPEMFGSSLAGAVVDAALVALPIPMIWTLQMSMKKRVQAIALLAVGFIATASSIIRTYYVYRGFHSGPDTSWAVYPIYFTTDVEIVLGIICACTPHIKPLVENRFRRTRKQGYTQGNVTEKREPDVEAQGSGASGDTGSLDFITAYA